MGRVGREHVDGIADCRLARRPARPAAARGGRAAAPPFRPAGQEPGDLYGKFTWRIDNFGEVSKRELRSATFEVGSYKW